MGRTATNEVPTTASSAHSAAVHQPLTDNIAHQRVAEDKHVRNLFDCIKSRQKPVADFEIGFHSTLPSLLGRQSIKDGRPLVWDETALAAKPA